MPDSTRRTNILITCLGVRIPIPFSISNLRCFLYGQAGHIINQGVVNEVPKTPWRWTHQALRAMMDVAKMLMNKENVT